MKTCRTCAHFVPIPNAVTTIGRCAFPLPEWLNDFLAWTTRGPRMKELTRGDGYHDCETWKALIPVKERP